MHLELNFRIDFAWFQPNRGADMVMKTPEQIAAEFKKLQDKQTQKDAYNLAHKDALDKGFSRLHIELNEALAKDCEELNKQACIGNILRWSQSNNESSVTRTDTGEKLSIEFDEFTHKVSLKCEKPIKIDSTIEVKPAGVDCYYADGKGQHVTPETAANEAIQGLLGLDSRTKL